MTNLVLIVDDEPALNELFVIGLRKYGFVTEGVLGGEECLEIVTSYQPDLIILDMMMEPMDGWETLTHLKNDAELQDIPVIMQTGKNLTYREAEQFSFYIEDYIMKPITPKRCIDHINAALDITRYTRMVLKEGLSRGIPEEKLNRFCQLHRAVGVSRRMETILSDRYDSDTDGEDGDAYGPEDFTRFRSRIENEYNLLKRELNPGTS